MKDNLPEIIYIIGQDETKKGLVLRPIRGPETHETQYRQAFNYF
jgi:hypothetical protein